MTKGRKDNEEDNNTSNRFSRRKFLKKAGIGAGIGLAGMIPATALNIESNNPLKYNDNFSVNNGKLEAKHVDVDKLSLGNDGPATSFSEISGNTTETGNQPHVHYASKYSEKNGGEQIQNAIDDLPSSGGTVIVGPEGPDDVSSSSGSLSGPDKRAWKLESAIKLPSHTTIILQNSYLFLDSGIVDNFFRNEHAKSGDDTRDSNISILGRGDATLDGNAENHSAKNITSADRCPIDLTKVDKFRIEGLNIIEPLGWSIKPEDAYRGYISDILFYDEDQGDNQDGVHIMGPAEQISVSDCRGVCSDDIMVVDAASNEELNRKGAGDVRDVSFTQIHANSSHVGALFRSVPTVEADGYTIEAITMSDSSCRASRPTLKIGGTLSDLTPSNIDLHRNLSFVNVESHASKMVQLQAPTKDLSLVNCNGHNMRANTYLDLNGYMLEGLCVTNAHLRKGNIALTRQGSKLREAIFRDCRVTFGNTKDFFHVSNAVDEVSDVKIIDPQINGPENGFRVESGAPVSNIEIIGPQLDGIGNEFNCDETIKIRRSEAEPSAGDVTPDTFFNNKQTFNLSNGGSQELNRGTPVNNTVVAQDLTNGNTAHFALGNGSVTELADPNNAFGTSSGTSSNSGNLFYDTKNNQHVLENTSGSSTDFTINYGGKE